VSVILDGENCWEHYPGGGVPFLRNLYEGCTKSKTIKPVQIGEFIAKHPPRDTLPRLFAGSWINHNFAIWVGHEEDNAGWDALHRTREHLVGRNAERGMRSAELKESAAIPSAKSAIRNPQSASEPSAIQRAWNEIYIAEGSDWFWWYGDEHHSAQLALFDYLFRKHLQNVYLLLGETPPAELGRPISRRGHRLIHTMPRSFLDVKIDGKATFFEWINAGHYTCGSERGTMALVTPGPIKEIFFGFTAENLLIRIDCETDARTALAGYELRIGFVEPPAHELRIRSQPDCLPAFLLMRTAQPIDGTGVAVAVGRIVEVAIPFARLGVAVNQPIQFYVELFEGDQSRDRAPREDLIRLSCPPPDFEHLMWDVMF
jgi:hypothetical protein